MRVLFTGGGTMGSVVPLIAIVEELKNRNPSVDCFWIGTKHGPEKQVVKNYNIEFKAISSGKLRRYFSMHNFIDVLRIFLGLVQSIFILRRWRPKAIVSAGGFVAVPVVWAGWLLGIPSLIHQQDLRVGLANKLCAPVAGKITVCFPELTKYFSGKKTKLVGNPVRGSLKHENAENTKILKQGLIKELGLDNELPIVLITTGGRGAVVINEMVDEAVPELVKFCQVVHIMGKNRIMNNESRIVDSRNYKRFEFVEDTTKILPLADLVVSRAGMGTLTEIAYLKKPAIIIPIPNSHQVDNAKYFAERQAVEYLQQEKINANILTNKIRELLDNKQRRTEMGEAAHKVIKWGAEGDIVELVLALAR